MYVRNTQVIVGYQEDGDGRSRGCRGLGHRSDCGTIHRTRADSNRGSQGVNELFTNRILLCFRKDFLTFCCQYGLN